MVSGADVLAGLRQELRRGTVVIACLARLQEPGYGYALLTALTEDGLDVDGNTLYPLLRRLETQGLLTSSWNTDKPRPRKYYATTAAGRVALAELRSEWDALDRTLRSIT